MRIVIRLLILFAVAVALALFAGENAATVSVFWPPWRVDLSLNLVLLGLVVGFALLYAALRALGALRALPAQARAWRLQQRERAVHRSLHDALAWERSGRYTRARRSALEALGRLQSPDLARALGAETAVALRAQAHLAAADASHALRDHRARDEHLQQILNPPQEGPSAVAAAPAAWAEAARLRAAQWALDDNDAAAALDWLSSLPQGAQRRTVALRLRLKAARVGGRTQLALETARLLVKHRAFAPQAGLSLLRSLAIDWIEQSREPEQVVQAWQQCTAVERALPEVAVAAARRLLDLSGSPVLARRWLEPIWVQVFEAGGESTAALRTGLVLALERCLITGDGAADREWLARIEQAQQRHPRDGHLQYLAGMACKQRELWGKAESLLQQAAASLEQARLLRAAWVALAELAERRNDTAAAMTAWKQAAAV
jgi:HemY protein